MFFWHIFTLEYSRCNHFNPLAIRIHQIFATIVGLASLIIGILRFFIPSLGANIPTLDGVIHIVTGAGFILGAWLFKGTYVNKSNGLLGVFYIGFGAFGYNLPHIILGAVALLLSIFVRIKKTGTQTS